MGKNHPFFVWGICITVFSSSFECRSAKKIHHTQKLFQDEQCVFRVSLNASCMTQI